MFKASLKTPKVLNIECEFQFNKQSINFRQTVSELGFHFYFKTSKKIKFQGIFFMSLVFLKVACRAVAFKPDFLYTQKKPLV